jgi:hypothetical protein
LSSLGGWLGQATWSEWGKVAEEAAAWENGGKEEMWKAEEDMDAGLWWRT